MGAVAGAGSAAPADTAALAALGLRIDALEKDMASLKSATAQATGGGTKRVSLQVARVELH
ncbi:MAG: hypothetical protein ACO3R6_13595 [Lutimaribacter sp.]